MIAKAWHLETKLIAAAFYQSGQHAHGITKQRRIAGLVDVGFNTGAVGAHFATLFEALLFGIAQNLTVDQLPGFCTDDFDIAVHGGFFKSLFGNADAAEPAQALRVNDVKGQLFIGETKKGLYHKTAQHLLGTHALCAGTLRLALALVQILKNVPADGRVGIDDGANHFKLQVLRMIDNVGNQGYLFLPFFALLLFCFCSVFIVCRLLIYSKAKRNATTKCAIFMSSR
jgi:hypothetical protein